MVGSKDVPVGRRQNALPRAAHGSINGHKVLLGVVLLLIAIASITGVVVAASSGQWQIALIIGLLSAAFFCRVGC
jgi:uncharacterized integral membrane protein